MNVRIAAQTLSSSVADALEYLMNTDDAFFKDAGPTIKFIRVVDRLFDLLNSKNPFAKGFKQPLRSSNIDVWTSVIDTSIKYLLELKDENGTPLLKHRRKTFVLGFVMSALSARMLASDDLYEFILTYKFSQDHLELLFSCIPDVRKFKSALKKILLRVSVVASKHANCLMFEDESVSPIFSLKWSRNRTPLVDNNIDTDLESIPCIDEPSPYKGAIVAYICRQENGGSIVLQRMLRCPSTP